MVENRNFYDRPFVAMIDSGTFWRCKHGHTRFRSAPGCGLCVLKRPSRWWAFLRARVQAWLQS
jgi:hypothetical protein